MNVGGPETDSLLNDSVGGDAVDKSHAPAASQSDSDGPYITETPVEAAVEEDEDPDELECLDEDLEEADVVHGLIDSELDSFGSPVAEQAPAGNNLEDLLQVTTLMD